MTTHRIEAISLSSFALGKRTFDGACWLNIRRNGETFLEVCDEMDYCIGDLQVSSDMGKFLDDTQIYELVNKLLP